MTRIVVIGGGVIGICCALELQNKGHDVVVVERDPPGEGTCWASCGFIAPGEIIPLSKPDTILQAPGWLMDPTGPLALRAGSALSILPWLLRFLGNSRQRPIETISSDIATLSKYAVADTRKLLARCRLSSLLGDRPVIELYDSQQELAHERKYHRRRRELGFLVKEISGDEAAEMEPSIAKDFACAVVYEDWRAVVDTKRYVQELFHAFIQNNGEVVCDEVLGFVRDDATVTGVNLKSGNQLLSDRFVVAAGAWSKELAATLGINVQMAGVIGYQTSLPEPGLEVKHGLIYAKGGFGITPYESGLAVGGSIEFAGLDVTPNWNRADIMVKKAKRVLPGLKTTNARKRIGRRPLTPDTRPIIGVAQTAPEVIFATGHGQLGLTLAATTARLVADIVGNRAPGVDLVPFRPDRF